MFNSNTLTDAKNHSQNHRRTIAPSRGNGRKITNRKTIKKQ